MATTGVDFNKIVDRKSDRAYSNYFNTAKKNEIAKEAVIVYEDLLYATNDRGRIRDELFSLVKTDVTFPLSSNTISLTTGITDYNHFLEGRVSMQQELDLAITGASKTSPIRLTFNKKGNLRSGDKLKIAGVLGTTTANRIRYIKMVNSLQGDLYTDYKLTIPVAGHVTYISGGTVIRYVDSYLQPNDQKTAKLGQPSLYYPKYEVANGLFKVLPLNTPCDSVVMDYLSKPTVFIDVLDNTIDLELSYSLRMIDNLADMVCKLMGESSRDNPLVQNSEMQLAQP